MNHREKSLDDRAIMFSPWAVDIFKHYKKPLVI